MRKRMSIREFKKYCNANKPSQIIFSDRNQAWFNIGVPAQAKMSFDTVLVFENPQTICFKSPTSMLKINFIDHVEVEEFEPTNAVVITIFCVENVLNNSKNSYVFTAS